MGSAWLRETMFGDRVHTAHLECGVTLVVVAKPGFVRTHAAFAVKYGSFDRAFRQEGGSVRQTPDGIAHFLEHTLFENRQGNALELFSRRGALINAGTSYRFTSYYFTAIADFAVQLRMLLEFVLTPHFTEENVAKEQGIIGQEISMYDDMPDDVRHRLLMRALFACHPINTHIAGTAASIAQITPELLNECFNAFYAPENMVLIVVGDVEEDAVRQIAEDVCGDKAEWHRGRGAPVTVIEDEPASVAAGYASRRMPVGYPKIAMGYKEAVREEAGGALLVREIETDFLVEMLFGKASPTYARLYAEGIIDESFYAHGGVFPRVGYVVAGVDTPRPAECIAAIKDAAARADDLLTAEDFARLRRRFEGEFIRRYNSIEMLAGLCLVNHINETTLGDAWGTLDRVTLEGVRERARQVLAPARCAVSAVLPLEWQGALAE